MKFKKFILIPALIYFYLFYAVDFLISYSPTIQEVQTGASSGMGEQIAVGNVVSVIVTRKYLFGLVELPVYTNSMGYIGNYHEWFFYSITILTVLFVVIEVFTWRRGSEIEWRKDEMKMKEFNIKGLVKAVLYGIVFAFLVLLLSGDTGSAIGLGMLLVYLEYKLKKLK